MGGMTTPTAALCAGIVALSPVAAGSCSRRRALLRQVRP